jgi:N-acyl-D-amino-acid deacylase
MSKISRRKFLQGTALIGTSSLLLGNHSYSEIFFKDYFDLLIINGTIIDGLGNPSFKADIGIKNDRIIEIGKLSSATAKKVINADGLIVSPGFIDIHTHTDLGILTNPLGESKIRQGVTLEVSGNCGSSFAPISFNNWEENANHFNDKYGLVLKGNSMNDFLTMLENHSFSVNQATLIGLGTIRSLFVGLDDRKATADELLKMKKSVEASIKEGAVGVASGLEYTPGSFADTDELIELCKAIPKEVGLYATHMRNEDDFGEEAVDEAIKIARESGARLQMSHLKASGKSNWHKAESLLAKMDKAIAEGLEIHSDRYPYVAYHTGLANLFPLWSRDGGDNAFIERLNSEKEIKKIKEYTEKKVNNLDGNWNGVVISGIGKAALNIYKGFSIQKVSEELNLVPFEAATYLIKESGNSVSMVGFGMSEKSTEKILSHPRVMIASDAGAHAPYPPMNNKIAHPRAYGTFPRAIAKYVKERKVCSLEEMIKKMTSMPADKILIKERGRLERNKIADITIFDFNRIADEATFIDSHNYPTGIPYVIVNGNVVIDKGEHTGNKPGKILRSFTS